jgi:RNA polymerase sigma-70 factor (ECF subfamily)
MPPADSAAPSSVAGLAALGRLLDAHRQKLLAMLRRRIDRGLGVRIDPEDVFQEACLVAQRRWLDFQQKPATSAYVWLYGLVRDQLLLHWRNATRGRRDLRKEVAWPDRSSEQLGLSLIASGAGPSTAAGRDELKQRIRQVLELLPDGDYEIVKMRHFDQLSFKQAAELLGIKENAASVRYLRALKRLRTIWEALFSEEDDER